MIPKGILVNKIGKDRFLEIEFNGKSISVGCLNVCDTDYYYFNNHWYSFGRFLKELKIEGMSDGDIMLIALKYG
jgi:hypothetical protein